MYIYEVFVNREPLVVNNVSDSKVRLSDGGLSK